MLILGAHLPMARGRGVYRSLREATSADLRATLLGWQQATTVCSTSLKSALHESGDETIGVRQVTPLVACRTDRTCRSSGSCVPELGNTPRGTDVMAAPLKLPAVHIAAQRSCGQTGGDCYRITRSMVPRSVETGSTSSSPESHASRTRRRTRRRAPGSRTSPGKASAFASRYATVMLSPARFAAWVTESKGRSAVSDTVFICLHLLFK